MKQKNWVLIAGTVLVATLVACSTNKTPTSPASASVADANAGASGETLKVAAPTLVSPIGGAQLTSSVVVLSFGSVTGTFASITPSYQIELKDAAGTMIANPTITTTSYTVTATLGFDTVYNWRVRATYQGAVGPWSSTTTFKTQLAGFITTDTIFDPLTTGKTVGTRHGSTTFTSDGLKLNAQDSYVSYMFTTPLEAGEFSIMEKGADEGNPGGKLKVMSMQEGTTDITDDDYRMTAELRGSDAGDPGAISCRFITGNAADQNFIHDCVRAQFTFTSTRWYFWKFTWRTGTATLEVRTDSPTGSILRTQTLGTGSHAYRPVPHSIYLGVPVGRNGPSDATQPGMTVKDVWVGPPTSTRPIFPAGGGN
jgi:hypothetical protein